MIEQAINDKVRYALGDQLLQIIALQAEIDQLKAELEKAQQTGFGNMTITPIDDGHDGAPC